MATDTTLLEALQHNKRVSGNQTLETRMADLAVWFHHNMHTIPCENVAARVAFLEKAMWIQMELNALLLERMRKLRPGSELWLPSGMLTDEFA